MNFFRLSKIQILFTLIILSTLSCCNKSNDLSGNLPDEFSTVCKKEYFYFKGSNTWLVITDEITAKPLPGYEHNLDNFISSFGLEKVKETNIYTLIRIPEITTGMESLNLANKMMENDWMEFATPNFIAQFNGYP